MTNNGTYGASFHSSNPSGRQSSNEGFGQWLSSTTSRPKCSEPCNWNGGDCGWRGFGSSGSHCGFGSSGNHWGFGNSGSHYGWGGCGSQGGSGHFGSHSGCSGSGIFGGHGGCSPWNKPRCCPPRWGSGWGN